MQNRISKSLFAAVAAVSLGGSAIVYSGPAFADPWHGPYGHYGWHGHHGYWGAGGWWAPGLAAGALAAGALAASQAYRYDCIQTRPIYDVYGNYIGDRRVNVCE